MEYWYRHRTEVEDLFRDTKHGAALRHLPSGHHAVNRAWMWGALLAATLTGWLHHLTATTPHGRLAGHGVRGGQAMIATLRWRLIAVPARLVRHARGLTLRLAARPDLLAEVLARLRALPTLPDHGRTRPQPAPEPAHPRRHSGRRAAQTPEPQPTTSTPARKISSAAYSRIRVRGPTSDTRHRGDHALTVVY